MTHWLARNAGPLQAVTCLLTVACILAVIITGLNGDGWIFNGAALLGMLSGWAFCALCSLEEARRPTG